MMVRLIGDLYASVIKILQGLPVRDMNVYKMTVNYRKVKVYKIVSLKSLRA